VATAELLEFNLEDTMNDRNINRRQALQNFGLVGVGAALAACTPAVIAVDPPAPNIDVDVLNFALNLEYLEAEFYLQAAFGRGLSDTDSGGGPASTGGKRLVYTGVSVQEKALDAAVQAYIEEIAIDEENHVKFLRAALGSKAVARPQIDIGGVGGAFEAAGKAASAGALVGFDPYANALFFLHGAFVFEDVGVTAYKGAARLLTNKDFLEAAAGILAVEAYHAGEIRTLLYSQRETVVQGLKVSQIVQAISDLRDTLGGSEADQGIIGDAGKGNILPTDANSIAFSRNTRQVLNIVYGAKDATKGLFFPNGLNGAIK
jgi:Ferritin-like domain